MNGNIICNLKVVGPYNGFGNYIDRSEYKPVRILPKKYYEKTDFYITAPNKWKSNIFSVEGLAQNYLPKNANRVEQYYGYIKEIAKDSIRAVINDADGNLLIDDYFPFEVFKGKPLKQWATLIYTIWGTESNSFGGIFEVADVEKKKLSVKQEAELEGVLKEILD